MMLSTCEHQESKLYLGTMWDVVMRCLTVWLWLVVGVKSVVHHYYYCYTLWKVSKVLITKGRKWEVQKRCCFDKNCSKWLFKLITTIVGWEGESLIVSMWAISLHGACKRWMVSLAGWRKSIKENKVINNSVTATNF